MMWGILLVSCITQKLFFMWLPQLWGENVAAILYWSVQLKMNNKICKTSERQKSKSQKYVEETTTGGDTLMRIKRTFSLRKATVFLLYETENILTLFTIVPNVMNCSLLLWNSWYWPLWEIMLRRIDLWSIQIRTLFKVWFLHNCTPHLLKSACLLHSPSLELLWCNRLKRCQMQANMEAKITDGIWGIFSLKRWIMNQLASRVSST